GVFFVTQTPKDVPEDVLAQLGSRVQHARRAKTPRDQERLRQSVKTFPDSPYDLEEVLTTLGTGEAVVTVLSEKGAPSPVAATRLRAPQANMGVAADATVEALITASSLLPTYRDAVDGESAYEMLTSRVEQQRAAAERQALQEQQAKERVEREEPRAKELEELERRLAKERAEEERRLERERVAAEKEEARRRTARQKQVDSLLSSAARTIGREITRSIFGTRGR
ncbi:MAG: DUF853 domain-containing protein, partial [Actinomycetes bacterium]|nr:DUF853 domain-containing protein [Actinomycetes bacterium]